jgi:hypothetical protein
LPRKPTENVQVPLRLREGLRQQLIREAHKNGVPVNREMANRLQASFEAGAIKSIESVAADLVNTWGNWKAQERNIRKMCETWTEKRGKAASA